MRRTSIDDDWLARRVVSADGARRGADGVALQRRSRPRSRSRPVRTRARSCRTSCRPGRSSSSRCHGCGRRRTRRCARRSVPIRPRPSSSSRRCKVGWELSEAEARGEAVPDAYEELGALGRHRRSKRCAAQIGLDQCEIAMTGAAPIPVEILQFFRSLGVPLSEIYGLSETSGPMTWTPFRVKIGTVGPPIPGVEVVLDTDGEVLHARRQRVPWLLERAREDGRGARRRRMVPYRRHRRARRRQLLEDRRPQEGTDHHCGRQEHLAREPRSRVEGGLAHRPSLRHRRQPAVRERAARPRRRRRARLGQGPRHRRRFRWTRSLRIPMCRPRSPSRWTTQTRASRTSRRSSVGRCSPQEWLPDSDELTPTMKLKRRGVHRKYADEIDALYS